LATDDLGADRRAHDLESAFRAHRDWLVRRLALIVGDAEEARDLAQEAFVRAAETWPLPDMTEPARWLSMVGVRLAIDERRRRRRWGFLDLRETNPVSGLGLLLDSGQPVPVRWPVDFSAEQGFAGAVLYDWNGFRFATEGQLLNLSGNLGADGVLSMCFPLVQALVDPTT
jgi:hypothetical protein